MGAWFSTLHPGWAFLVGALLMSALVAVWSGIGYAVGALAHSCLSQIRSSNWLPRLSRWARALAHNCLLRIRSWLRIRAADEKAKAKKAKADKKAKASVPTLETPHKWVLTWGRGYLMALAFAAVLLSAASVRYYLNGISRTMPGARAMLPWPWWWLSLAAVLSLIMSIVSGWKGQGVHGVPAVSWAGFGIVTSASPAPQMVMVSFDKLLSWLLSSSHLVYLINGLVVIIGIGVAGVALVLRILWRKKQREKESHVLTATRIISQDKALESGSEDRFGRKFEAKGLARRILAEEPGWVLGIGGEWGSGKTTFMNLIDEAMFEIRGGETRTREMGKSWALEKTDKGKGLVVVRLNLWEHQHDAVPAVALLQAARDQLPLSKTGAVNRQIREIVQVCLEAMATAGNVLTTGSVARPSVLWNWVTDIAPGREVGFEAQERAFSLAKKFAEIISRVLDFYGADRLVFMLDDLDRCMPEQTLDILEKVQLFFRQTNCVFVLGVDTKVLELAVSQRYSQLGAGGDAEDWGHKYLKKIVSIWYPIPDVGLAGRRKYVDVLLQLMPDSFEREEVAKLFVEGSDEAQASLRRVKELVNQFILYHAIEQERELANGGSFVSAILSPAGSAPEAISNKDDNPDEESVSVLLEANSPAPDSGTDAESQVTPPPAQTLSEIAESDTQQPDNEEDPFPATGKYDSWLLAAVTAIQVLHPDEYKKMALPGQSGKQAIREWFCVTEETGADEGSSVAKPHERLRQAIMSHIQDNAALEEAIRERSEDLVKEVSHYIQLVVNSAATEEEQSPPDPLVPPANLMTGTTEESYDIKKLVHFGGRDWRVLDRRNVGGQEQALLLSEQILTDLKPYHNLPDAAAWQALVAKAKAGESLTWAKCTLREWLNTGKPGQSDVDPWVPPPSSYVWVPSSDKDRDASGGRQKSGESVWGKEGFLSNFHAEDLKRIASTLVETKSQSWSGKIMDAFAQDAKRHGYVKRRGWNTESWAKNWMSFHEVDVDNEVRVIPGGDVVECRVFLFSLEDCEQYLPSDKDRVASRVGGPWWWWLRSPGSDGDDAALVDVGGWLGRYGSSVHYSTGGVRPALWLNL